MLRNLALLASIVALVGCGESNPPTEKVTGTVTLDGTAVEGAIVTFMPDDSANKPAVATTQADGTYSLTTFVAGDGAMAGSYKIKVFKYDLPEGGHNPYGEAPAEEADEDRTKMMTQEEMDAAISAQYGADLEAGMEEKQVAAKNELPEKYADHVKSGLTYTVVAGDNVYDLTLTKK